MSYEQIQMFWGWSIFWANVFFSCFVFCMSSCSNFFCCIFCWDVCSVCTVSSSHLIHYPEKIWQITWILMGQQHFPWELLKEFLDYLPKQLLPNFFTFRARRELSNTSTFLFPFEVVEYILCLIYLSYLCSSQCSQISYFICIRAKGNGKVLVGTHLMGDTSCSPRLTAMALCFLHPALPLRILATGLPEKEIRIIQMSI